MEVIIFGVIGLIVFFIWFISKIVKSISEIKRTNELKKRADDGDMNAQYDLAILNLSKNINEAILLFDKSASQGHSKSQYALAVRYLEGSSVEKNLEKGFDLLKKAADQELSEALYRIHLCYISGEGVEKNPQLAVEYLKKAAEKNNPNALYDLGYLYMEGNLVDENVMLAQHYFREAKINGSEAAQFAVGFKDIDNVFIDKKEGTIHMGYNLVILPLQFRLFRFGYGLSFKKVYTSDDAITTYSIVIYEDKKSDRAIGAMVLSNRVKGLRGIENELKMRNKGYPSTYFGYPKRFDEYNRDMRYMAIECWKLCFLLESYVSTYVDPPVYPDWLIDAKEIIEIQKINISNPDWIYEEVDFKRWLNVYKI